MSPTGLLDGVATGTAVLLAKSHGIQAATAINVGTPTDRTQQLLSLLGMSVYPQSIALPSGTGTRQLSISVASGGSDLTAASTGTVYFVSNPAVIAVSPDGLVQALSPGVATITAINGLAESVIPVIIQTPQAGPITLGADGGVVRGTDGSIVAVPAGDLPAGTTVDIAPVTEASLPMALPTVLHFLYAVHLDVGSATLGTPVELAVPMPAGTAPGTEVYVYRAGSVPNTSGGQTPIWFEDEIAYVGADGMARTASPPYPGITISGYYMFGFGPSDLTPAKGHIYIATGIDDGGNAFEVLSSLGGGIGIGAAASLLSGFVIDLPIGDDGVTMEEIPRSGPPIMNNVVLHVQQDSPPADLVLPNPSGPTDPPIITGSTVDFRPAPRSCGSSATISGSRQTISR